MFKDGEAPRITPKMLNDNIVHTEIVEHHTHTGQVLRWAILTTKNGFAVTGNPSASVSPENDDPELGGRIAEENAKNNLWSLMGYELRTKVQMIKEVQGPTLSTQKTYVGTKVVHALPMNRRDYNLLRKWNLPKDENGDDEGYLVEYPDSDPQTEGWLGYLSWSPKEVFEKAYHEL